MSDFQSVGRGFESVLRYLVVNMPSYLFATGEEQVSSSFNIKDNWPMLYDHTTVVL